METKQQIVSHVVSAYFCGPPGDFRADYQHIYDLCHADSKRRMLKDFEDWLGSGPDYKVNVSTLALAGEKLPKSEPPEFLRLPPEMCMVCGKPTRTWLTGHYPLHAECIRR